MSSSSTHSRVEPIAAKTRGYYRTLSATSLGIEVAAAILIGIAFGWWLDSKAGTTPWLMILFLCLGFVAAIRAIYRAVREADNDAREREAEAAEDNKR
jgi:ATP synthase protein I